MFFLRCIADPIDITLRDRGIALCWADVESLAEARSAADAMARDGGWVIAKIEDAGEASIDEFGPDGQGFFRQAEARGVHMVVYTTPEPVPDRNVPR